MLYRYRYQLRYWRPYRYRRYGYWCRTELTEVSSTGIDVPNLPKYPVPVLISYWTYRSVQYRYWCCTELNEVSRTGIDAVSNLPKYPVPVLILYRTYRSIRYLYESLYRYRRYRYWCRTKRTEASSTGIDIVRNLPKCLVPVSISYGTYRSARHR